MMVLVDKEITSVGRMTAIHTRDITREVIVIGLGDIHVSNDPYKVLTCIGLGSCIALCIYDPITKLGGMAHIVLPSSINGRNPMASAKYADSAVPMLLKYMSQLGAIGRRLVVKVAGGANMLSIPGKNTLNIGERNILAVKEALAKEKMSISGAELGGTCGRSVRFFVDSGRVLVQTIGKSGIEL
ncbi:chemotaxis protein CheD [Chloroflexota bacterium]